MVLKVKDKSAGWLVLHFGSSRFALPIVPLPLIQEAAFQQRNQFLGTAMVVGEVGFSPAGCRHFTGVVKIVTPDGIQAPPPLFDRANGANLLALAFCDEYHGPRLCCLPDSLRNFP